MIKFNKYNVRNTETGAKARVYYSLDNHVSGKPCVCVRGKDVLEKLIPVFGEGVQNDSDSMTDYSEPDRVRMFEDHPLYVEVRPMIRKPTAIIRVGLCRITSTDDRPKGRGRRRPETDRRDTVRRIKSVENKIAAGLLLTRQDPADIVLT
jgi:hypothetical protein